MKKLKDINKTFRGLLIMGLLSILIGFGCMIILSGGMPDNIGSFIMNTGYSLMLGYGLFANGLVISLFEDRWLQWVKRPIRSFLIVFAVTTIYSGVVILFTNWFWYGLILNYRWDQFVSFGQDILKVEFTILYIITLFFYARGFFKEWKTSLVAEERLKQEAISLQYKVLSNQVNPHFLFNSLNVLSSLIKIDTDRADVYVNKLSSFYRGLLGFRGKEIISLTEELDFVQEYVDLQKERFGNSIIVEMEDVESNNFQVVPMSVQMLVENAIKHNEVSKENVLKITVFCEEDYLVVKNTYQPYLNPVDGERLGLINLSERYKFLANRPILLLKSKEFFTIKVPLLKIETELV